MLVVLIFNFSINSTPAEPNTWNEEWGYSQEIIIPINTEIQAAKYQPVDIRLDFENRCWVKNEEEHSIRVCSWDGYEWHELESQIYDLQSIDNNYISSCSLVFLIPEFADGNEKYFVYYSDSKKNSPDYKNHVQIEESYYHYEPISGYALESSYFKITDEGYCNYIVSQEGHFMGYNTGQHITKMNEKTIDIKPKNGDTIASFDFKYSYGDDLFDYSSTSQKMISKEILNDGNLMVEFGMISRSKLDDLQTTANYKYYHCPTLVQSRIHVHIKHEALKDITLDEVIVLDTNTDGTYATLQTQAVKSKTINDLNLGKIYPFLHYNNEIDTLSEIDVDIDPEYIPEDLDIRIISLKDDVDLGKNSWVSFDDGETGTAHAIIFYSNDVLKQGNNERNGLQINSYEMDYPHLPGLENNMANIVISRNSYEIDGNFDTIIPQDFIVEFDAEFFTTRNDGYKILDDEAKIFRNLIENKPEYNLDFNNEKDEVEKHTLSINVHQAPSIPMGSSISALFGKNFSFITVEIYKEEEYISSESAVRLPMEAMDDFDNSRIIKTIIQSIKYFEWRNLSFYKKVIFSDIEESKYVVKIFRENSIFSKHKQYIGFAIVDLKEDTKININCRSEGIANLILMDQNGDRVENAEILLINSNSIISKTITNTEGEADIRAPKNSEDYSLQVVYKGLFVYDDLIKINSLSNLNSDIESINIERYNIDLEIFDKWDLSPEVELNPVIVHDDSNDQIVINSDKKSASEYVFKYIPPGDYYMVFRYKSYIIEEKIKLTNDLNLKLEFPAEYEINIITRDSRGLNYPDSKVYISRNGKKIELAKNNHDFSDTIPPGEYNLEIYDDQELIYNKNINILGDTNFDIVTKHDSLFTMILLSICIILIMFFIIYSYLKKNIKLSLIFIPIILVLMSILFPWWTIQGSSNQIESSTSMFLYPMELVTITTSSDIISGERAYIPDLFILVVNIFLLISFVGCILTALSFYFYKNDKKKIIFTSLIVSLITFIIAISMFIFALNELSSITVGSIIGQGNIDSNIFEEGSIISLYSNWGFGNGFYIYLISNSMIFLHLIYFFKSNEGEEFIWWKKRKKLNRK